MNGSDIPEVFETPVFESTAEPLAKAVTKPVIKTTDFSKSDPTTAAGMRLKAMDLLARREHSRYELADKLTSKLDLASEHMATLDAVLKRLIADDLLSDERFAEALVRSKLHKGQGPRRIVQELQKRGVRLELASVALTQCEADWFQLALSVAHKKYGDHCAEDLKEKARRSRFLQYRGFDSEHIAYALSGKQPV